MRRNCNLELRLFPSSDSDLRPRMEAEASGTPVLQQQRHDQQHQQNQPLTIFYDGKICVSDVTELQARSILMLANKEMEERGVVRTPTPTPRGSIGSLSSSSEPSSPMVQTNLYSPGGNALSMKRSLQRFLQKRRNRVQEASPYNHHH